MWSGSTFCIQGRLHTEQETTRNDEACFAACIPLGKLCCLHISSSLTEISRLRLSRRWQWWLRFWIRGNCKFRSWTVWKYFRCWTFCSGYDGIGKSSWVMRKIQVYNSNFLPKEILLSGLKHVNLGCYYKSQAKWFRLFECNFPQTCILLEC